jgi:hypothetical protein
MANVDPKPETINKLRFTVDARFAMLAGMQLDLFTPLKAGPMTAEELAAALGVSPGRLRLLLYVLVAAELLTEQDGRFSNTDEANGYLVKASLRTWAIDTRPSLCGGGRTSEPPNPSAAERQAESWISPRLHPRHWKPSCET